jgi:sugar/nucleoside kinase (ribokinase family)
MKSKGFAFIPVIVIIAALCVGSAAYFITKKNDSPIEQAAEAVLKTEGVDIDFSPDDCTGEGCND